MDHRRRVEVYLVFFPRPRTLSSLRWRDLLGYRQVWAIVLARFLTDPVGGFTSLGFPSIVADARGFSLTKIGLFAWVPERGGRRRKFVRRLALWLFDCPWLECRSGT